MYCVELCGLVAVALLFCHCHEAFFEPKFTVFCYCQTLCLSLRILDSARLYCGHQQGRLQCIQLSTQHRLCDYSDKLVLKPLLIPCSHQDIMNTPLLLHNLSCLRVPERILFVVCILILLLSRWTNSGKINIFVVWQMVTSHGSVEAEYKEGREYLNSRTAEKYMNTDVIGLEDRAAGTRTLHH